MADISQQNFTPINEHMANVIANNMIKVMEAVDGGADAKAKAAEAYALALNAFCDGDE